MVARLLLLPVVTHRWRRLESVSTKAKQAQALVRLVLNFAGSSTWAGRAVWEIVLTGGIEQQHVLRETSKHECFCAYIASRFRRPQGNSRRRGIVAGVNGPGQEKC